MRKIILHAAALDRRGNYRDAGSELTVGAEDNNDTDISTANADELLASGRAGPVESTTKKRRVNTQAARRKHASQSRTAPPDKAAEQVKVESVEPAAPEPAAKTKA